MQHDQRLVVGRAGPTLIQFTSADLADGRETHELRLLSLAPGAVFVEALHLELAYETRSGTKEVPLNPPLLDILEPGAEHMLLDVETAHERLESDSSLSDCTLTVKARIHEAQSDFDKTFRLGCDVTSDSITFSLLEREPWPRPIVRSSRVR